MRCLLQLYYCEFISSHSNNRPRTWQHRPNACLRRPFKSVSFSHSPSTQYNRMQYSILVLLIDQHSFPAWRIGTLHWQWLIQWWRDLGVAGTDCGLCLRLVEVLVLQHAHAPLAQQPTAYLQHHLAPPCPPPVCTCTVWPDPMSHD